MPWLVYSSNFVYTKIYYQPTYICHLYNQQKKKIRKCWLKKLKFKTLTSRLNESQNPGASETLLACIGQFLWYT